MTRPGTARSRSPRSRVVASALVAVRALAGLCLIFLTTLATALPAQAESGELEYAGTVVVDSGATYDAALRATVDCVDGVCVLVRLVVEGAGVDRKDVSGGIEVPFIDGVAAIDYPVTGDPCDPASYAADFHGTATLTAGGLAIELAAPKTGPYSCPDGSETYEAGTVTGTLALVAGELCLLDDSCAIALPLPATPTSDSAARPSTLSELPTVAEAVAPLPVVVAIAVAVVLVVLMVYPTKLLASSWGTVAGGIAARMRPLVERAPAAVRRMLTPVEPDPDRPLDLRGLPLAAICVLAASIIAAFVNPDFGFDAGSLRSIVSILVGFALTLGLGWFAVILVMRRTVRGSTARFEARPWTLLLVLALVVLTRVLGLAPGIVFGLVAGVAFGAVTAAADKARAALVSLGVAFAVSIVAWIGYSLVVGSGTPPADVVGVFLLETAAGLAVSGIVALPLGLLPVRGFVGRDLFAWRPLVWAIAYAIGLVAFLLVVIPMPRSWGEVPVALSVWIALYLLYCAFAVTVWSTVRRVTADRARRASAAAEAEPVDAGEPA